MIYRSTNIGAALRSRQRGFLLNPYRFKQAAGWTPAAISPKIWLDWDSPLTANAGNASLWRDNSGNNNHFTQSSVSYMPIILDSELNGRRVLRFDLRYMYASSGATQALMRNTPAAWAFVVYKKRTADTTGQPYRYIINHHRGAGTRFGLLPGQGADYNRPGIGVRRLDGNAYAQLSAPTASVGSYVMVLGAMQFSSGLGRVFVNGELVSSNPSLTTAGNTYDANDEYLTHIGAAHAVGGGPNYFADVDVACVLEGVGSIPGQSDIDKLFGWAAHACGLQANLPPGHPYRNSPPQP